MTQVSLPQTRPLGRTSRTDRWWLAPLATFLGLMAFVVYATWGALQNEHYWFAANGAQYLSPFYSPLLFDARGLVSGHAWFGAAPNWWPQALPFLPAFLVLWAPGGFRFTCYYYRGAYYKAFWLDPPSCAVGEPRKGYRGENSFPLIIQNVHRFLLYFALIFLVFLAHDAWLGFWFVDPADVAGGGGSKHFGVRVGSLVLLGNLFFLGGYTLGCHSLRHLVGGGFDRLAGRPARKKAYDCVSCLNRGHMRWAWASLFWVGFTDLYVRMCSMGYWSDLRIL